jgi:hypothetical protein
MAQHITRILRLNHFIIIASLALGIVGGLDAFSTSVNKDSIENGKLYLRIAAGLSVAAWALICLSVFIFFGERKNLSPFYQKLLPVVGGIVMPILVARLVYTVGIAVTIDTNKTQVFNPLKGIWVLYLFLAFLPEVAISSTLVVVGIMFGKQSYATVSDVSEDYLMRDMRG